MINIQQLHFGYAQAKPLFSDLFLQLGSGHICGLLGKNGAGKTSLLRLLSGLLFADSGEVEVLGCNPCRRGPQFLNQLYFVPEELTTSKHSIKKYVELYAPFYPLFDMPLFKQNMLEFKLNLQQKICDLSYGQKKKFFISFGLATMTPLLILDEPTNGLDIPSKTIFRKLLAKAATEDRLIIISTHQVHDVENLVDQIVMVDTGRIILNASTAAISEKLSFITVDDPEQFSDVYYKEKTAAGYRIVCKNTDSEESLLDLELLFNTICLHPAMIQGLFEEKSHV